MKISGEDHYKIEIEKYFHSCNERNGVGERAARRALFNIMELKLSIQDLLLGPTQKKGGLKFNSNLARREGIEFASRTVDDYPMRGGAAGAVAA